MTLIEQMAALDFAGLNATEVAGNQMLLAFFQMCDSVGGTEEARKKLNAAIAKGADTKHYKKWVKSREVLI